MTRPGIWGSHHWLDEERRSAVADIEPIGRPDDAMNWLARFFAKVQPEPNTGCWLWDGALNRDGYGHLHAGQALGVAVTHPADIDRPGWCGVHHVCPPDDECDTCAMGHELGHDLADHPVPCEKCGELSLVGEEHQPVRGWVACTACLAEYDRELSEWLAQRRESRVEAAR